MENFNEEKQKLSEVIGWNEPETPYEALGVSKDSSLEEIKKQYQKNRGKWHPDKFGQYDEEEATRRVTLINKAWEVLRDRGQRYEYEGGKNSFWNEQQSYSLRLQKQKREDLRKKEREAAEQSQNEESKAHNRENEIQKRPVIDDYDFDYENERIQRKAEEMEYLSQLSNDLKTGKINESEMRKALFEYLLKNKRP